jgi:glycosyltransferase
MKISIVTVCRNSAATIGDTLRSVAAQRHRDIEHIVIDGASTDTTLEIVREHGTHVSCVLSEPDRGIYDAMNKGLALATGDFVGFLNADDAYANEKVLERIAGAASDSQSDVIYGDLVYVDQNDPVKVFRRWHSGAFAKSKLRFGWMPPHPTFYVRTQILKSQGGFDTRYRIAADYDCMMRSLLRPDARVAYVDDVLVHMRTGGASNHSLKAVVRKSREDLHIIRRQRLGGIFTLACKNLRKIPQLF